jgi:phenylacetate-CoA ligase
VVVQPELSKPAPLSPRSACAGAVWPALPNHWQAWVLSLLFQFERSQWWAPEALRANQGRQLARLVAHTAATVPFYRERLTALQLAVDGRVQRKVWQELPRLTRRDIQEAGETLVSSEIPRQHGKVSSVFTSGSTGRPLHARRTALSLAFWEAFTLRDHIWHTRDLTAKLAVIRHADPGRDLYPGGICARNWGHDRRAVYTTGPCVMLNVNCSVEQQVEWLQREAPRYFLTFPTIAQRLAQHCIDQGITLPGLEQVILIGEIVGDGVRATCGQAWGAAVTEIYSSREVGYIALQCPVAPCLHVQSEGVLVEVLDDDGRACEAGEIGRVVLTPLHNFAMPLIRYEIGDFAEVGDTCRCGRGLPVLRRVLGRAQNMVVLPSGEKRWTLLSSGDVSDLLELAPICQYQFAQTARDRIEARLAVTRKLLESEEQAVRRWVVAKLDYPFEVTIRLFDEIPRTASGKFMDFVSEM